MRATNERLRTERNLVRSLSLYLGSYLMIDYTIDYIIRFLLL